MDIILLERVEKLGQMGDVVTVKPGYARNFLIPQKKALRATKANQDYFAERKAALVQENTNTRAAAEELATKVEGLKVTIIRQASEAGHLYGSVSARDIAEAISATGVEISRQNVILDKALKVLGLTDVKIALHPEIIRTITLNIARSEEEAAAQIASGRAMVGKAKDDTSDDDDKLVAFQHEDDDDFGGRKSKGRKSKSRNEDAEAAPVADAPTAEAAA